MNRPLISIESIRDEAYRAKFVTVPHIISEWAADHGGLARREILDFGCGEGTSALGIALANKTSRVVGVDIMRDIDRCLPLAREQLEVDALPENLRLYQVKPGALHTHRSRFDLIYSWSVFEHIDQSIFFDVLGLLYKALRPGGLLFVQIAPLYFSSEGSHLCQWVPEPWGHLTNQDNLYHAKLARACNDEIQLQSLLSMYTTLNRITASQLVSKIEFAGFEILREYRSHEPLTPSKELCEIYREDALLTNQVVILANRPSRSRWQALKGRLY